MADTISQADRWLTLDTRLGPDMLLATEVSGTEGISELFEFRVSALSPQKAIAPGDLLGSSVTLSMARPGGERRIVNGIVTSLAAGLVTRSDYRLYSLVVSPKLWTLGRTSDYRVFQGKSVADIISTLLDEGKVTYEKNLKNSYSPRDYCTQFGETDLAFLLRLLSEEGIFFYFKHSESDHSLILCDGSSAYADAAQDSVEYRQDMEEAADAVSSFALGSNLTEASWTLRDYNYEKAPDAIEHNKKTALKPGSSQPLEQFRYPGDGMDTGRLTQLSSMAVDAVDAGFEITEGRSTAASFTPGHRFTVKDHPVDGIDGKQWVLTRVRHEARDRAYFTLRPGMEGKPYYRNSFDCIPANRPARAQLRLPKPIVSGPQTAVVTGKKGSVSTDEYGRISVRFFWDREGQKNDKATCLVRVAQPLAGAGWGGIFIPRGGMEVVVHFLDGDPDRPLVTGAVYNSANTPPWISKSSATKNGLLSRSIESTSKEEANELSFDDKAGSEKITFHAQKDFLREVENDDTLDVQHDQTRTIKNNRTTTISEGDDKLTVSGGNHEITVSKGDQTFTVSKGNQTITISAGNQKTTANGGSITIEAMQGITLKCGQSTIKLTSQGIEVNGMQVKVTGTSKAETKAPMVNISADATAVIKGGMVKIN